MRTRQVSHAVASVAFRAARLPIQTLAVLTTLVFVLYVVVVEIRPAALPTNLARSFVVESAEHWTPAAAYAGDLGALARFIGTTVSLPADAPAAVQRYVASLFGAEAAPLQQVLVREDSMQRVLANVHVFDVAGSVWELQSAPSWLAYSKYFAGRLRDLLHDASWFDIGVVSAGWIGMNYTFFNLFLQMRAFGSRTFLFVSALISSGFAFASAYALTVISGTNVPKLALIQALPFFVLVVGFNNKVELTKNAFRYLLNDNSSEFKIGAADAVKQATGNLIWKFFRDSVLESAGMLCAGLVTSIPGLFQFAILSALVLAFDLFFLTTFYAACLSLKLAMVRVERNNAVRRALLEDGVASDVAKAYADDILYSSAHARAAQLTRFTWFGGSVRLLTVFALMAINWLHIVKFPITLSVYRADLAPSSVADFAVDALPLPCVLTLIPPLRFVPANRSWMLLDSVVSFLHSAPMIRVALVALIASLAFNGYLVSLVMRHDTSVVEKKIPVVVRVPAVAATETDAEPVQAQAESRSDQPLRSPEDCALIVKSGMAPNLTNEELVRMVVTGQLPLYALEKQLKDTTRAVVVRRVAVSRLSRTKTLETSDLPFANYNYDRVLGACCENVIGYMPLPIGVAGPVLIDGEEFFLPLATTEGVLVASTMRGCKALNAGGGVTTEVLADGMTRGPCVTFATAKRAAACKIYLDSEPGRKAMEKAFNSTSRFARLDSLKTALAGPFLYIRFRARTGDAMGMNMISKGTEKALQVLAEECGFEDMTIVSVSGNYCTDKKAAAVNWIEGRGKSVVAECIVPGDVIRSVLKTGVDELVELNMAKNLVGSGVAGVLGGFNAHAANLVAALFLATGQDPAQVVESANCMTLMNNFDGDLQISVTMPSLEVGTIGGGTILEPQAAILNMLGVRGPHMSNPGDNARKLARIIATAVLAGELSLNSALAAGHLVKSHMAHNRAPQPAASAK